MERRQVDFEIQVQPSTDIVEPNKKLENGKEVSRTFVNYNDD